MLVVIETLLYSIFIHYFIVVYESIDVFSIHFESIWYFDDAIPNLGSLFCNICLKSMFTVSWYVIDDDLIFRKFVWFDLRNITMGIVRSL